MAPPPAGFLPHPDPQADHKQAPLCTANVAQAPPPPPPRFNFGGPSALSAAAPPAAAGLTKAFQLPSNPSFPMPTQVCLYCALLFPM